MECALLRLQIILAKPQTDLEIGTVSNFALEVIMKYPGNSSLSVKAAKVLLKTILSPHADQLTLASIKHVTEGLTRNALACQDVSPIAGQALMILFRCLCKVVRTRLTEESKHPYGTWLNYKQELLEVLYDACIARESIELKDKLALEVVLQFQDQVSTLKLNGTPFCIMGKMNMKS